MTNSSQQATSVGPFTLKQGEQLVLRGGSGGLFMWMCLIMLGPAGLFFLGYCLVSLFQEFKPSTLICLLPGSLLFCFAGFGSLLLSGRYWVTTQRLLWKPWLGGGKELEHADLKACKLDVSPTTKSLTVRGPTRMSLRCITKVDRLWGALTIFQNHGTLRFDHGGEPVSDFIWAKGHWAQGTSSQVGFVLVRPGFVAFLPSQAKVGLASLMGDIAKGLAMSGAGVYEFRVTAKMPFELFLPLFARSKPDRFDRNIQGLAKYYGGLVWTRDEAKFSLGKVRAGKRKKLRFLNGKASLNRALALQNEENLLKVLEGWQREEK